MSGMSSPEPDLAQWLGIYYFLGLLGELNSIAQLLGKSLQAPWLTPVDPLFKRKFHGVHWLLYMQFWNKIDVLIDVWCLPNNSWLVLWFHQLLNELWSSSLVSWPSLNSDPLTRRFGQIDKTALRNHVDSNMFFNSYPSSHQKSWVCIHAFYTRFFLWAGGSTQII